MSQIEPIAREHSEPGRPERRLAAAMKQLSIAGDQLEGRDEVKGRIETAIREVEAARDLMA